MPFIHDTMVSFDENRAETKPQLVIKLEQEIPDEFISTLKRDKIDTLHTPEGELMRVASVPTGVIEKWRREGFDFYTAPVQDILKRLRNEHLDAFITTNKSI